MVGVTRRTSKHWILRAAARQSRKHRALRSGAAPHRPLGHPQLLHHRPHRPRQVDAGRPDAAGDRCRRRPHDACAVPGPDGHRARARHHHQEPGGPAAVHRAGRPHLRPEHDRHPGPRRLHLRGVAVARRVRGLRAAGRRRAGHRGADAGQPVPRAGERPADHPGAQQDRPAVRAAGEVRRGARAHHRLRPGRRAAGQRQDRRGRRRAARRDRPAGAAPGRRPGRAGPSDDLRQRVRRLPRRHHLRAGHRRQPVVARAHPDAVDQGAARDARDRRHLAGAGAVDRARRRRGRLPDHRREGRAPVAGR